MTDIVRFESSEDKVNIIKVMGVGGGGSNAVTHMYETGITGVDFVICNTDDQALQRSPVENKLHLGDQMLGAGNVPAAGRKAAEDTEDRIRESLGADTKMLFITAGMGGGTGTGAAPVVAKIARELGILTVGIVTLPFSFEGKRRQQQARDGITELRKNIDALLVISNDKLREEYGDMKLTDAFKRADDVLNIAAKGIAEIITVTGYVNVDFKDVDNIMRDSGKAIMGSGYADGKDRALHAVEEAVHSPLLDDSDITGAKNILAYITSGEEEVTLDEVTEIIEYVQDATGKVSEVIWGNGEDMALGKGIRVTLIATGFAVEETLEPVKHTVEFELPKNTLKGEPKTETETHEEPAVEPKEDEIRVVIKPAETEPEKTVEPPVKDVAMEEEKSAKKMHSLYDDDEQEDVGVNVSERSIDVRPDTTYGKAQQTATPSVKVYDNPFRRNDDDDVDVPAFRDMSSAETITVRKIEVKPVQTRQYTEKEELRRARLASLTMNIKTQQGIENMENVPAYARLGVDIDAKTEGLSHTTVKKDLGLSEDNTYINVDVD
ncbi:MAG: cell division protein FtsZ [Bacteroidales bacterium]|nr:cell division protein FtsZ [Bacteroidales bacterium]